MRVAPPVPLDETTRRELERLSRKRSMEARVVVRSRIVLLASDGLQNRQIAGELGVSTRMAALWGGRFLELGLAGLLKDATRPGRTPKITSKRARRKAFTFTSTTPAEPSLKPHSTTPPERSTACARNAIAIRNG